MHWFRGAEGASDASVYKDREAFFADLAAIYKAEVAELAKAGCTYLQLDDTNLAYLCDPNAARTTSPRAAKIPTSSPRATPSSSTTCVAAKPAGMTVAHAPVPRQPEERAGWPKAATSRWPRCCFNEMDVDGYFLEYDDAARRRLLPLRFLPKGKTVVLGLVTTKHRGWKARTSSSAASTRRRSMCRWSSCAVAAMRLLERRRLGPDRHAGRHAPQARARDAGCAGGMEVRPLGPVMGAEVRGVDLSRPVDIEQIQQAFDRHLLLVFPAQSIDPPQHIAFSRGFGELQVHVLDQYRHPQYPKIYLLSNVKGGKTTGEHPDKGTLVWHSDLSFQKRPGAGDDPSWARSAACRRRHAVREHVCRLRRSRC